MFGYIAKGDGAGMGRWVGAGKGEGVRSVDMGSLVVITEYCTRCESFESLCR